MSIDATIIVLGPGRVAEWAFDNQADYAKACEEEAKFIPRLETELSRQIGQEIRLPASLLDMKSMSSGTDTESYCEIVGGSEGLRWLQDSIESFTAAQHNFRSSQPIGNISANELCSFHHILKHDAVSGIFLPIDFPEPFTLEHRGDHISVASLPRLRQELQIWKEQIFPFHMQKNHNLALVWQEYFDNLLSITDLALRQGKAIELI